MDVTKKIGTNAGKIWVTINTSGQQSQSALLKNTKLSLKDFHAAVGWLARENKIYKDGPFYKLGETNLTNRIGNDAGKIWNLLSQQNEIDITSIAKITEIRIQDAYSALGWLARENKIEGKKIKTNPEHIKYRLK